MKRKQFSLIELLVVISIISILASLVIPSLAQARKKSKSITCRAKLKQIHLAIQMYSEDNDYYAPGDSHSNSNFTYWQKTLEDSGYLSYDHLDSNSIYLCPSTEQKSLNGDWSSTYAMNFKFVRGNGSGSSSTNINNYGYLHRLVSDNPTETMLIMDGHNNYRLIQPGGFEDDEFYNQEVHVIRHLDKANLSFLDGHVESKSSAQLTLLGTQGHNESFWTP